MPTLRTRLFFDGGCRPNPGPIETAVVARGVVHQRRNVAVGGSNDAEWRALLHAVEVALALDAQDVEFVGDSTLVINQARGLWPCRDVMLAVHLAAFRAAVAPIPRVRLRHVARAKNLAGIALARNHPR